MLKIYYFFLLSLIKLIFSETCTYSISCNEDLSSKYCATKKRTESNNIFEIKVKQCPSMPCDIYNNLLGNDEKNTTCESSQNNIYNNQPSYPGGVCSSDLNCLSGVCISGKCVDKLLNEECHNHENCPLNLACIKGSCRPYLSLNYPCEDSFQCEFDLFCNKITKRCQKLFSLNDGVEITDLVASTERMENLCKSGGFVIEKNINGSLIKKCETLTNLDNSCNDICRYKRKSNGEIYESEEKCMCGYNKYRSKYCVLGNGEQVYKEHLENKINFMKNKNYTKFCHTLERDLDEICLELINTDLSVSFRRYVQNYNNKKILALQHHRLQESEECIKGAIFNYDTKKIFNINQTCPKFTCDTKKENCLYGINPLNEKGNDISVILNQNWCHEKEYCTIQNEKEVNKIINASLIMENEYLEGMCKIFQENINIRRYPGEQCNFDVDCILPNSTCNNGKCSGGGLNDDCNETFQCLVGLYCNKELGQCKEQKGEGQTCVEGWDCQNYLGCFKGRCIKFGLLKKGIKVSWDLAPFPGEDKRNYLCYTGELEQSDGLHGNFCVENDYDDNWVKSKGKNIDEDGFIECNFGEKCYYINGKNKFDRDCQCGYNKMGQGFCPLPSARNREAWVERMKFIGNSAKNGCHSLSRFNCYLKHDYNFYKEKRQHDAKTLEAHLFHNSIDCAYKVFVKQNYIKYSFYFIGLLFVLL